MAPRNERTQTHRHLPSPPPVRRKAKSKPAFEIPVETELRASRVGWVYRAPETAASHAASAPRDEEETSTSNDLSVAGVGLFFIGVGTAVFVSLTALGLVGPVWLAKQVLDSD